MVWLHHRSTTELPGVSPAAIAPDLVAAAGADAGQAARSELMPTNRWPRWT